MKWKTELKSIDLNMKEYKRALFAYLKDINERAGQIWLFEATEKSPIPTYSGASRASFDILAAQLNTSVPIGPLRTKSRIAEGLASGSRSKVYADKTKWYVGFQFVTTLGHLIYNERFAANPGPYPAPWSSNVRFTPYNFIDRSNSAWKTWAATQSLSNIPNPWDYLTGKKI
jgi:hypothetical protein